MNVNDIISCHFDYDMEHLQCLTRVKTHNLFTVDENRPEQCCAAHIVLGC